MNPRYIVRYLDREFPFTSYDNALRAAEWAYLAGYYSAVYRVSEDGTERLDSEFEQ